MVITNFLLVMAIITLGVWYCKLTKSLTPLIGLVQLFIILWGMIVESGYYAWWTYDIAGDVNRNSTPDILDSGDDKKYYCHYTPYIIAFVLLIIKTILVPFIIAL